MLTRTSDTLGEDLSPIGEPAVLLPHEPEPKVHRRDELWLLIHVEVQGRVERRLPLSGSGTPSNALGGPRMGLPGCG